MQVCIMKPLLENDKLVCAHQGVVQLKSDKGKDLLVDDNGVITESDLMNSPISGCSHNILGVPKPCTKIVQIPPNALSETLEVNGEGVVLEDMVSMIMTDNGVPLQLQGSQEKSLELDK